MSATARTSVTIEDVARAAGVSRAAVSKVIRDAYGVSDEMRTKVRAAIDDLGYRPRVAARAMRGASYTIGIELPSIENDFFAQILRGATAALAGTRYQLIIAPAGPDHDGGPSAIETLADRQVDGILAVSPAIEPAWLERLARHVPLVMLGRHDDSVNYDTIVDDDVAGVRLAVRHLYDLGHRDIAHLTIHGWAAGNLEEAPHPTRSRAYSAEMAALGLAGHARVIGIDPTVRAAHRAALEVLREPSRPTAIVAGHDELALGVLRAMAELGLTASDVSVTGYDDTDIASHPRISLTSVNQSGPDMGELVIRLLLERINGRSGAVHKVITPRLVIRNSTAPVAVSAPRRSAGPGRSSE